MRKFPKTMSFRLTNEEVEKIKNDAKALGLNVNGFLRKKVLT
jgi:predicted DNA binding CopG/RHH family protein